MIEQLKEVVIDVMIVAFTALVAMAPGAVQHAKGLTCGKAPEAEVRHP